MKAKILFLLMMIPLPLLSQNLKMVIDRQEFLSRNQKNEIYFECSQFTDYVFIQSKLSEDQQLLYQEILEVFFLEKLPARAMAKGLYFSYLCKTKGFTRYSIVKIAFPLALTSISPPRFLETIEYYQFLLYEGFSDRQALKMIYQQSGYQISLSEGKKLLQSHLLQGESKNFTAAVYSSQLGKQSTLKRDDIKVLKQIYEKAKKQGGKEFASEVTQAILSHPGRSKNLEKLEQVVSRIPVDKPNNRLLLDQATRSVLMNKPIKPAIPSRATGSSKRTLLIQLAQKYIGTPYKWGGNTIFGMDCSGFVQRVYLEAGIQIPRTSSAQGSYSKPILLSQLKPGDLLFFGTSVSKRITHVGIFLGNNRFIHASSSKGVTISNLKNRFYKSHLLKAGKIL